MESGKAQNHFYGQTVKGIYLCDRNTGSWTSLVVQWIGICLPNAGDTGSTPGQGRFHRPQSN